jgi:hypothetical protein
MFDEIRELVVDGLEGGHPGTVCSVALVPKQFILGSKHQRLFFANERGSFKDSCIEPGKAAIVIVDVEDARAYQEFCARVLQEFPANELEVQVKKEVLPEYFDRTGLFGTGVPTVINQGPLGYRVKRSGRSEEWIGVVLLHFEAVVETRVLPEDVLVGAADRADAG